jgi:transcriptional regulator with XRE-family HTH domain
MTTLVKPQVLVSKLRDALDARRLSLGWSWNRLAAELGVSTSSLTRLGDGHASLGPENLKHFANWLGRDINEFYSDYDPVLVTEEDHTAFAQAVMSAPSRMPEIALSDLE